MRSAVRLAARGGKRAQSTLAQSSSRVLEGRRPIIQPWDQRPKGLVDQLTGRPVEATCTTLGVELPNVDLTQRLTMEEIEAIKQASDDAGGIVVMPFQKESMSIHDHVRFGYDMAESDNTGIEPHAVAEPHPEAPEVLEIVREANAKVVFGENWHSDNSFMGETCSYSILRGVVQPRLGGEGWRSRPIPRGESAVMARLPNTPVPAHCLPCSPPLQSTTRSFLPSRTPTMRCAPASRTAPLCSCLASCALPPLAPRCAPATLGTRPTFAPPLVWSGRRPCRT